MQSPWLILQPGFSTRKFGTQKHFAIFFLEKTMIDRKVSHLGSYTCPLDPSGRFDPRLSGSPWASWDLWLTRDPCRGTPNGWMLLWCVIHISIVIGTKNRGRFVALDWCTKMHDQRTNQLWDKPFLTGTWISCHFFSCTNILWMDKTLHQLVNGHFRILNWRYRFHI